MEFLKSVNIFDFDLDRFVFIVFSLQFLFENIFHVMNINTIFRKKNIFLSFYIPFLFHICVYQI